MVRIRREDETFGDGVDLDRLARAHLEVRQLEEARDRRSAPLTDLRTLQSTHPSDCPERSSFRYRVRRLMPSSEAARLLFPSTRSSSHSMYRCSTSSRLGGG